VFTDRPYALNPVWCDEIPMAFAPGSLTTTASSIVNGEPRCSVEPYSETVLVGIVGDLTPRDQLSSHRGLARHRHPGEPDEAHQGILPPEASHEPARNHVGGR
jgi:hypothetical protein